MPVLDLEEQLVFYGSYHTHPTNIAIHILFVPILMFGLLLLSSLATLPSHPYLNLSTLASLSYSTLYILMEPLAGALITPLILGMSFYGTYLQQALGSEVCVKWVLWSQVVAWGIQFVGHGVWEKKAPALKDNLVQALFLAPFFVWLECLFAGGYRRELKERCERKSRERRAIMDGKVVAGKQVDGKVE